MCTEQETEHRKCGHRTRSKEICNALRREHQQAKAKSHELYENARRVCDTITLPLKTVYDRPCQNCLRRGAEERAREEQQKKQARSDATKAAEKYGWKRPNDPRRGQGNETEVIGQVVNIMPAEDMTEFMSNGINRGRSLPPRSSPPDKPLPPLPQESQVRDRSKLKLRKGPQEHKPQLRAAHVAAFAAPMRGSIHSQQLPSPETGSSAYDGREAASDSRSPSESSKNTQRQSQSQIIMIRLMEQVDDTIVDSTQGFR